MKKIIKLYIPEYGRVLSSPKGYRNQANGWVIENIHDAKHRTKYDKNNKNQVNLFLLEIKIKIKIRISCFFTDCYQ